ncbi:MAG: hypothetical protein Q4B85_12070 [Lachnospiraceae bacterium]|nr:hypothetical protein [Lachnospiraceae bacterium]
MINIFPEGEFEENKEQDENQKQEQELSEVHQELLRKYSKLEEDYRLLEEKYTALLRDFENYKHSKSKAGRKPNDEKWTARYQAFARLKDAGKKRQEIQLELDMSRATYFRYNKIYSDSTNSGIEACTESTDSVENTASVDTVDIAEKSVIISDSPAASDEEYPDNSASVENIHKPSSSTLFAEVDEVLEKAAKALTQTSDGLVLDPETGEFVTPEGLKRRKKLAEIRARRAAEEEMKRKQQEQPNEAE